jgi:membrane-associated phospholipid phosphatase
LGSDLAVSFLVTSALTISLKYGIDRKRPNGAPYSMPSGHTSGAFSSVPVIWHHLGWQTGLAFGSISTLTALARIEDNKHYTSDVVAGATLGLVVGRLVIARRNVCDWQVNATPGSLVVSRAF